MSNNYSQLTKSCLIPLKIVSFENIANRSLNDINLFELNDKLMIKFSASLSSVTFSKKCFNYDDTLFVSESERICTVWTHQVGIANL